MRFMIFQKKNIVLDYKKGVDKVQTCRVFERGQSMVLVKNWNVFHLFYQAKLAKKRSCTICQKKKTTVLIIKKKQVKKSKNWDFSKGVSPWFWSKNGTFSIFLFEAKYTKKMTCTICLKEKTPVLTIKTTSQKSRKIGIFPKGLVHGFGQILEVFPSFYLRQNRPRK